MQLGYLIDIFEDNFNTVRDRFGNRFSKSKRDEKKAACSKETKEISIYITWLSHIRKPWKLSLGTTTLKTFVSHTGL